ncbi:MAG TPA: hypothetical protein VGX91_07645 [Candidatus Cybelea sp.]|jgi:hypothetical protein|nr:hypothetical protein [Candidatus Cybelea sp.]
MTTTGAPQSLSTVSQWLGTFFGSKLWPGIGAFATCLAATGALVAGYLAWRSLCETRKAERIKHTIQLLDSTSSQGFADILNTVLKAAAPENVRTMVQARVQQGSPSESDQLAGRMLAGYISYAADLISSRIVDNRLFVHRSALQIALAVYIYEPVIAGYFRQALGRQNAVVLIEECIRYARAVADETGVYPQLKDFSLSQDLIRRGYK